MIGTAIRLHDIRDAEGFVAANIHKSRIILSADEREDLLAEGLAILCDLARKYEPHRPGYAHAGSFAGYAAKYLPGRMRDAFYAMHPEHVARREDGRRIYEHGTRPMSINHEDMPQLAATAAAFALASLVASGWDPGPLVSEALTRVPSHEGGFMARRVVELVDEGFGPDEIARTLRMDRGSVARVTAAVGSALHETIARQAA
ncbi:MAG: hypothetical protein LC798_20735 [Chloroflexi bacterium]|nr:hypothetical protein [Chloroflexota bacterium]